MEWIAFHLEIYRYVIRVHYVSISIYLLVIGCAKMPGLWRSCGEWVQLTECSLITPVYSPHSRGWVRTSPTLYPSQLHFIDSSFCLLNAHEWLLLFIKVLDYYTPSSSYIPEEPIEATSVALWQNRLCYGPWRRTFSWHQGGSWESFCTSGGDSGTLQNYYNQPSPSPSLR